MNTGTLSIPELVRMHSESYRDVKEYMNNHKEAVRLSVMIKELQAQYNRAGNKPAITAKISSLKAALEIKERHMKSSKIHELVEAGMFQTVVEDVETSSLNTNNKITSFLDEVTGKLPGVIREPARILYLSDSTAYAKISKEFLQLSDLMARDMVNRRQKVLEMQQADGKKPLPREFLSWYEETYHTELNPQQRLVGEVREVFLKKAKESRHYNLLKSFINYNQPNGRFEEWLNRAGLFMFTKYVKNIQRIITQTSVNHPVKTILSLLTFQFLFNQDIIHDQAFMIKGFGQDGEFGLTNIFPFYNPLDSILTVVNPPLIQLVT
jgi:Sec-independent protein translocase protein TatA